MSEHERIWLEPATGADEEYGRQWCQDNVWDDGVEYVLADTVSSLTAERDRLREAFDRRGEIIIDMSETAIRLRKALKDVEWWAQQKCPCHEETPNPCPLCGASVENLEACKAVESVFPREILKQVRAALSPEESKP